MVGTKVIPVAT